MRRSSPTSLLRGAVLGLALVLAASAAPPAWAAELLMFELKGCPWCVVWRREIGPIYPLSAEGLRAPLRIVDIKAPVPDGLVLDKPVTSSPTFVLVEDGREVGRITGYPGADFFWGELDELLAKLDPAPSRESPPGQRSL